MLRHVDLKAVLKSGVTTSSFHNRSLPRPATAVPGKNGNNTCYVNVGSLQPNDSWVSSQKTCITQISIYLERGADCGHSFLVQYIVPISAPKHTLPIATPRLTEEVRYGQYITHAQSHITRAVVTGSGNHGQLFRPHKDSSARHSPRREVSLAVIDPAVHCLVSLAAVFWMSRNARGSVA